MIRKRVTKTIFSGLVFAAALCCVMPMAASGERHCRSERSALKAALSDLFGAQHGDGRFGSSGDESFLGSYPLSATLSLQAVARDDDRRFLESSRVASRKYLNHLLATRDTDGDFMLESLGPNTAIEDVGFNAMLALDMGSVSHMCARLGDPIEGLFWYKGMKTVARQLVDNTFDGSSGYFHPWNNENETRLHQFYPLSSLPIFFTDIIGDNFAAATTRNYLLREQNVSPEIPSRYLKWLDGSGDPLAHALGTALLLDGLNKIGFQKDAAKLKSSVRSQVNEALVNKEHGGITQPTASFLQCSFASKDSEAFFPRHTDLELFQAISQHARALSEDEFRVLQKSLTDIRRLLDGKMGEPTEPDIARTEQSIRSTFWMVSSIRTQWQEKILFSMADEQAIPGFDIHDSFSLLLDDIVHTLRRAEDRLSTIKHRDIGLDLSATILTEKPGPGEPIDVRFHIGTQKASASIQSLVLSYDQSTDTVFASSQPLTVAPNAPPETFVHAISVSGLQPGRFHSVRFSTEAILTDGRRIRHYFNKSVFASEPIELSINFPNAPLLRGNEVPIQVRINKKVSESIVIGAQWYSHAGLQLKEGRSLQMQIPQHVENASLDIHAVTPEPCRPGSFPFAITLFKNGVEMGTISSKLFKHYQWVYAGPFSENGVGLNVRYRPDTEINLFEPFANKRSWMGLQPQYYLANGTISIPSPTPIPDIDTPDARSGVMYFHTLIKTDWDKRTGLRFSSNVPAVVFINSTEVIRTADPNDGSLNSAWVDLVAGLNIILVKLVSDGESGFFFELGSDDDTPDELENELSELMDGYERFQAITQNTLDTEGQRIITFKYVNRNAQSVSVIGTFNGWSPATATMRQTKTGEWELDIHLAPGRYAYRFLVDNTTHVLDPQCTIDEADGYGGRNSVLVVR